MSARPTRTAVRRTLRIWLLDRSRRGLAGGCLGLRCRLPSAPPTAVPALWCQAIPAIGSSSSPRLELAEWWPYGEGQALCCTHSISRERRQEMATNGQVLGLGRYRMAAGTKHSGDGPLMGSWPHAHVNALLGVWILVCSSPLNSAVALGRGRLSALGALDQ